jgi:hypothetical protein
MRTYKRSLIRNPERKRNLEIPERRELNLKKVWQENGNRFCLTRDVEQFRSLGNTIINLLVPAVHKDANFLIMQKYIS